MNLRPVLVDGKRVASPTYRSWQMMKNRCLNPRAVDYRYYGGRGIKVCPRWYDFDNFVADMGVRPSKLTLERKRSNRHYNRHNCVWATRQAQSRNRAYCKLQLQEAKLIRKLYRGEWTQVQLAARFKCSQTLISMVVRGVVW